MTKEERLEFFIRAIHDKLLDDEESLWNATKIATTSYNGDTGELTIVYGKYELTMIISYKDRRLSQ